MSIRWTACLCAGLTFLLPCRAQGPAAAPAAPAAEAAAYAFDLMEFEVEGNTVLDDAAIERVLTPFVGPGKSMAQVEAARAALEAAYQGAGYLTVFVDVPEQRVDEGVVRLAVTEGRVSALRVKGSRYFSQGWIRAKLPALAEGEVPNFNVVQQELAQLNRTDDRQVRPVMRPGQAPGTVEVELQVADKLPLSGSVELTNQHPANTTATRLTASLRYDNLFQADHSLALTFITAPEKPSESKVLAANYTVPGADGTTWLGSLVLSDSVVEPLGATTVVGKGTTLGLRRVSALGNVAGQYHSLALGVDYKNLKQRVQSGGDAIYTPLRYLPFTLAYSGNLSGADGAQTTLSAQWLVALRPVLSRLIDCPGASAPVDQFSCSREGAEGGFSTLKLDVRHTMPVSLGGTLALRANGQLASGPLVSSEQFYAGGASSVRGYLESEATGDAGFGGSVEWRSRDLRASLGLAPAAAAPAGGLGELVGYGFLDAARTQTFQAAAGQSAHTMLAGTGLGLRLRGWKRFTGELELGWPLRTTANTADHSPRAHLRFGVQL